MAKVFDQIQLFPFISIYFHLFPFIEERPAIDFASRASIPPDISIRVGENAQRERERERDENPTK